MIYLDTCAILKFVHQEPESDALRAWRSALPSETELFTSELAQLELTRTLLRHGTDHQRVPYVAGQALHGIYTIDLTTTVLARAMSYSLPKLGALAAIHLSTADPFRIELTAFVTYDKELTAATESLGLPVEAPA